MKIDAQRDALVKANLISKGWCFSLVVNEQALESHPNSATFKECGNS